MEKKHANRNIHCSAVHCAYNKNGELCQAEAIEVGSPDATRSSETMCSTYEDKQ